MFHGHLFTILHLVDKVSAGEGEEICLAPVSCGVDFIGYSGTYKAASCCYEKVKAQYNAYRTHQAGPVVL